ncbi:predicted DsbA family dithiol-disulfide isomerase [Bacillus oleivorans]|uniref:Predicted DsbA family dithiol-disulfide isomerase n=1 Tax=Bacillus oleivorans TaxID=1448271 RepID=A0A285CT21_9BACI|nr:DsbA family protein [Bacillus oleivorans]SNX70717.1 predicted DsbA family dithiol-disulfide isomerase [Bacillus oleivorans]
MTKLQMVCDLETGICGLPGENPFETIDLTSPKKSITLYYVTDPICSHCWALEPVLHKFEEQYGQYINIQTLMGGLLESWDGFADLNNGIGSPSDVAAHWREVGEHSRMPIDGTLWLDNPVHSSYPPSRVFKVIQQKDEKLANTFLRKAREAVFVFNQNIAEDSVLIELVNQLQLDGKAIVEEARKSQGQRLLMEDFALARSLGVRGFPTIIMVNEENKGIKIVGSRPFENYVKGLIQALGSEVEPQAKQVPSLTKLLEKNGRLFAKEIEVMYDVQPNDLEGFILKELAGQEYKQNKILGELYIEK